MATIEMSTDLARMITSVLPIGNGGTGQNTALMAFNALAAGLGTATGDFNDNTYLITTNNSGATNDYYRRSYSILKGNIKTYLTPNIITSIAYSGDGNAVTALSLSSAGVLTVTKGATYNNYSLPLAASNTRGGAKIGYTTDAANRNYAVQLNNEQMYVNVPWTDHYAWTDITGKPNRAGSATDGGSATTADKVIHTASGTSYIAGAGGTNAAVYAKKSTGSVWYPAVALQTSGGGAWQIGNYNNEVLEFHYATAANISSETNSTTKIFMQNGDTGRVMTDGNYSNWVPSKTGSGASGTWSINITGTAATATTASSCSGNAASATQLQTARTIWGQSFNGTGNITGNFTMSGGDQINMTGASWDGFAFNYQAGKGTTQSTRFYNGNAGEIVRFAGDGNVGIGVTSPSYKLHVAGTIYATGQPAFYAATSTSTWSYVRLHNGSNLWDIATKSDHQGGALELRIGGSDSGYYFHTGDMPAGAANFNAAAVANSIKFYRNGILIPNPGTINDGGFMRVKGTGESDTVLELGTWDDYGTGETIQFNYYPTSSQITPTYSIKVPKRTGSIFLCQPWWTSGNGNNSDNLRGGCTFAYTNHNCPTNGMLVAFDCDESESYTLQLQGNYGGRALYFRNRNGDNGSWNAWSTVCALDVSQNFTADHSWGSGGAGGILYGGATNGGLNSMRLGDDIYLGDCNASGILGLKSTSTNCGFYFHNSSGTQTGQFYNNGSNFYMNKALNIGVNGYPSLHLSRTDAGETSIYFSNNTAGWAMGLNVWSIGAGQWAVGQYSGTGAGSWRFRIDNNAYCYTASYLNLGGGKENNASSPYVVWGSNSGDNFLRSYQTTYLSVKSLASTGYGDTCMTYYQTSGDFDGNSGWCHYIICNHGNGSSYYHYTIGLPFWSTPRYRRQTGDTNTVTKWYKFWTEENLKIRKKTVSAGSSSYHSLGLDATRYLVLGVSVVVSAAFTGGGQSYYNCRPFINYSTNTWYVFYYDQNNTRITSADSSARIQIVYIDYGEEGLIE